MEIRNWDRRNSQYALYDTNRELESQRLELSQAIQWSDRAQREKINSCGELEMRSRLFQESRAKIGEESVAKEQMEPDNWELMNCPCNRRGILLLWVSSWLKFRFTEQGEILGRCNWILPSWNSEQLWSIPRSQPTLEYAWSQTNAKPRLWIAARYTEYYGSFRKRFWKSTCSRRTILSSFREFTASGIIFLRSGTRKYYGTWKRSERRSADQYQP